MIVEKLAVADSGADKRGVSGTEGKHMKPDSPVQHRPRLEFGNYLPKLAAASTSCIHQRRIPHARGQGVLDSYLGVLRVVLDRWTPDVREGSAVCLVVPSAMQQRIIEEVGEGKHSVESTLLYQISDETLDRTLVLPLGQPR